MLNINKNKQEYVRIKWITQLIEFGLLEHFLKLFHSRKDFGFAFLKIDEMLFQHPREFLQSSENRKRILKTFEEFEIIEKINEYGFLPQMVNNYFDILRKA